jgi:hypothetical protein
MNTVHGEPKANEVAATYSVLSDSELLHLAEARGELTEAGRAALTAEMAKRNLGEHDVAEYAAERLALIQREQNEAAAKGIHWGFDFAIAGKRLFGSSDRVYNAETTFEEFDAGLWFTILGFPVVPLRTVRIRRNTQDRAEFAVIACRPRDWQKIRETWLYAAPFLLVYPLAWKLFVWLLDIYVKRR